MKMIQLDSANCQTRVEKTSASVHREERVEDDDGNGECDSDTDDEPGAELEGFVVLGIEVPDESRLRLECSVVIFCHALRLLVVHI